MNRRRFLSIVVAGLFLLLLLAFVWIFFTGIGVATVKTSGEVSLNSLYDNISQGQSVLRRYKKQLVWVTHINDFQRQQAAELDEHLLDVTSGCQISQPYCVLSAVTLRDGINIQFSQHAPAQLPAAVPWLGGFVDPISGKLYDLFGRGYRINGQENISLQVVPVH